MACRGLFYLLVLLQIAFYLYLVKIRQIYMKFIIKNNITHKEFEYYVEDLNESSIYYVFNINIPDSLDDGEYTYVLKDDGEKILATGLMRVGDYKQENKQYINNKDKYIQYGKK